VRRGVQAPVLPKKKREREKKTKVRETMEARRQWDITFKVLQHNQEFYV
jgi:hypothetical protein